MKFVFPDSGVEIEIERVPFIILEMLRSNYQENYPGKPVPPKVGLTDDAGNTVGEVELSLDLNFYRAELAKPNLDAKYRETSQERMKMVQEYLDTKAKWDDKVNFVTWQATRLLYARKLITSPDPKIVQGIIDDSTLLGIDLRKDILQKYYPEAGDSISEDLMNRWIYLWLHCVRSASDSGALNSWMNAGSQEAQRAVRNALVTF